MVIRKQRMKQVAMGTQRPNFHPSEKASILICLTHVKMLFFFFPPFITLVQFQRQLMTSLRTRREPKDNFHPTSEPRTDIAYTIIYLMASYLQDETGAEKASSPTGFTRLSIRVLPSFCFLRLLALSASPPLMLTLTLSG